MNQIVSELYDESIAKVLISKEEEYFMYLRNKSKAVSSLARRKRFSPLMLVGLSVPVVLALIASAVLILPHLGSRADAINGDCTLIVPPSPLTAQGLATPYQLQATNTANGPCHENNANQSVFVQAAILDPANGHIAIYNPLVIDAGTQPLATPTPPVLPQGAVVGIWGGGNDNNTTLQGTMNSLRQGNCVNGVPGSVFGQFWYCNASQFFLAARQANVQLSPLGTATDGMPCPTVRDFFVVDQDQSDNVQTTYLVNGAGQTAQNTATNRAANPGATVIKNPSDNRLLTNFLDPALGCTPALAPDLADNGTMVPALALDELQAAAFQQAPAALVPVGDPMVQVNGRTSILKDTLYRLGVDQMPGIAFNTKNYCLHLNTIQPDRLVKDAATLAATPSPLPNATNLLTFMGDRFTASFQMLNCQNLTGQASRVTVATNDQGMTTAVMVDGQAIP
jgi:hypothetical protein